MKWYPPREMTSPNDKQNEKGIWLNFQWYSRGSRDTADTWNGVRALIAAAEHHYAAVLGGIMYKSVFDLLPLLSEEDLDPQTMFS